MKKSFLLAIALCASSIAFSQDVIKKSSAFSMGPTVGFGHSFLYPFSNSQFMPSWNVGLTGIYAPTLHWGIGADVKYSAEGSRTKLAEGTRRTELGYIRVPVRAIYFFGQVEDNFRPKITLGPSIGFLVNEWDSYDVKANSVDVGAHASVGFNYQVTEGQWLNVDLNYYHGFTDVRQHTGITEMNGNLGLTVGYAFGI